MNNLWKLFNLFRKIKFSLVLIYFVNLWYCSFTVGYTVHITPLWGVKDNYLTYIRSLIPYINVYKNIYLKRIFEKELSLIIQS